MKIIAAVTTAERPTPTLPRCLASLKEAGFADPLVLDDTTRSGSWPNFLRAISDLLARDPDSDALLVCQDDAVFCAGLAEFLSTNLWPADDAAICSPYCPTGYGQPTPGWHEEKRGWYLVGAVCWVIRPSAARLILRASDELSQWGPKAHHHRLTDARIGRWAEQAGWSIWYHRPSLVQHLGCENSSLGVPGAPPHRVAGDFIGEHANPVEYLKQP